MVAGNLHCTCALSIDFVGLQLWHGSERFRSSRRDGVQVFEIWYKMLQDPDKFFRRAYDKKLSCTGLVCLLGAPAETLPSALKSSLPLVRRFLSRAREHVNFDTLDFACLLHTPFCRLLLPLTQR